MASLPPDADLSKIPLAPNPSGQPPNFIDPPSLSPDFLAIGIFFIIVSVSCVTVRLVTYLRTIGKLFLDDYLCLFGLVGAITYWALTYSMAITGTARHSWDVPMSLINASFIKKQTAGQIIMAPTALAVKTSILLFYVRIFENIRWLRLLCFSLIALAVPVYGSNAILPFIFCFPWSNGQWDASLFGSCAKMAPSTLVIGSFTVVVDIALFIIPLPVLAKLKLGSSRRRALIPVFLVAFLIVVTSVVGLAYRIIITVSGSDALWHGMNVSITSSVETFATIIISCVPSLSSFWHKIVAPSAIYSSLTYRLQSRRGQHPVSLEKNQNEGYSDLESLPQVQASTFAMSTFAAPTAVEPGPISFTRGSVMSRQ